MTKQSLWERNLGYQKMGSSREMVDLEMLNQGEEFISFFYLFFFFLVHGRFWRNKFTSWGIRLLRRKIAFFLQLLVILEIRRRCRNWRFAIRSWIAQVEGNKKNSPKISQFTSMLPKPPLNHWRISDSRSTDRSERDRQVEIGTQWRVRGSLFLFFHHVTQNIYY